MSCYYCVVCKKPTHSIRHHARYCHIFDGTKVVPNSTIIPTKHLKVSNCDSQFYCTECKDGVKESFCVKHRRRAYIRHMGVYICQTTHFQLTVDMLHDPNDQRDAVELCKQFASCSARKVYMYGEQENQLGICCVCGVITDKMRHCKTLTKIYHDGSLEPDPLKFPVKPLLKDFDGEYYCFRCKKGLDLSVCKVCNKTSTHRWLSNAAGSGYVTRTIYNSYTSVHHLNEFQKARIFMNLCRLVVENNVTLGLVQM